MNELSLFAGAGGGIWGSRLLKWRTVGYVEINSYCQAVIARRIKDGCFDEAPIFGDIQTFLSDGYAASYKGLVDIITGGFPCQDVSWTWAGPGLSGDRSGLWGAYAECIRAIRPKYVLIENVENLRKRGLRTVLRDLALIGYDARWSVISAEDVGAPHERKRLWVLGWRKWDPVSFASDAMQCESCGELVCENCGIHYAECTCPGPHSEDDGWEIREETFSTVAYPDSPRCGEQCGSGAVSQELTAIECNSWWVTEPGVGRISDGVAHRCSQLRALGNGQVPAVVRKAWRELSSNSD